MYQVSESKHSSVFMHELLLLTSIIIFGYIASHILFTQVWVENNHFMHNSIELFCVFLMVFAFIHIWSTYSEANQFIKWIGFGALIMVILNLPHIINFGDLVNMPYSVSNSLIDISLKHGVVIAYFEVLIWLMLGFYKKGCAINKWIGLLLSLCIAMVFLVMSIGIVNYIPMFYSKSNITINKRNADALLSIIALMVIAVYMPKYRGSTDDRERVMYTYILLSMSAFIPSRICFAVSGTITSPMQFMGHIFKLEYFSFIYYGVYKATVQYPYMQIKKTKDFYSELLETAPFGIITFDEEDKVNYASSKCHGLFRCDRRKLLGLTIEQLVDLVELHEICKAELLEKLWKQRDETIYFYGRTCFANGSTGKMLFTAIRLKRGIIIMVTDAKRYQAIENMRLRTQTLLNSIDNIVLILGINMKVFMCNKKLLDITGVKTSDVLELDLMELSHMFKSDIDNSIHEEINSKGVMHDTKWTIRTKNGDLKKISLDSSPIYDVDNEKIGWIIIGRDISRYEEEQEKIINHEKMAIVGQMAAGLVHEIKNPLASIKGLCQLMQTNPKVEKIIKYAAVMEDAVDDIGAIITSFLQFSKPTTTNYEKSYVNDIISSIEILISTNVYKYGIKVEFSYSNIENPVLMSSQQIKNAVLGMVDNAIDAMNGAIDPKLDISTEYDRINNMMHIKIKDNGIGMTDEQLACIGTPFYTTKSKGTGLGVSTFKNIVNEHGGNIKIESKFAEGSAFTIYLPCLSNE